MEKVCRADVDEIGRTAKELTDAHFPTGDGAATVRFAVAYEHRASKDLDRMEVINSVVNQIPQVTPRATRSVDACNNATKYITVCLKHLQNRNALNCENFLFRRQRPLLKDQSC